MLCIRKIAFLKTQYDFIEKKGARLFQNIYKTNEYLVSKVKILETAHFKYEVYTKLHKFLHS